MGGPPTSRPSASTIISLGRDSAVYHDKSTVPERIAKSYSPEQMPGYRERYTSFLGDPLRGIVASDSEKRHLFLAETAVLKAASTLPESSRFAPGLLAHDPATKTFYMEEIGYPTFRDYFFEGNNTKAKTRELVETLAHLHGIFGNNLDLLYQQARLKEEVPVFKARRKDEEYGRWLRYFKTIIYRTSGEFGEFFSDYKKHSKKPLKLVVKSALRQFLQLKNISLEEEVKTFINRDWQISFGEEYGRREVLLSAKEGKAEQQRSLRRLYEAGLVSMVHGDFMPQNVFRVPQGIKVCDFSEMRIDRRSVDLVGALYNIYNAPITVEQEANSLELIGRYVEKVRELEGLTINSQLFTVRTLEARLKNVGVGLFAIDCKYIPEEIRGFVAGWEKFDVPNDEEELQRSFLEKMFSERFAHFADYLLREEGWGNIYTFPHAEVLREQVKLVEKIFTQTGVLGISPSAKRAERIERALGDGRK